MLRELLGDLRMRLDHAGDHGARGRQRRPNGRWPRRVPRSSSTVSLPAIRAVSRILTACLGSALLRRNSTWSSAISTATRRESSTPTRRPKRPAATSSPFPSSRSPGTRPKTCCCARRSSRVPPKCSTSSPRAPVARPRWWASPMRRAISTTRPRSVRNGRRARRLPQAPVAELRGVRRAALLRAVHRRRPALRGGRRTGRGGDLRRRVEPERPDLHAGGRWRRARREHQRVALLRGPDPRAGDDARDARGRRVGSGALREPRRRPRRARLRRRVDALRRGRSSRRPGQAVRRRPARRRRRRSSRVPAPTARSARRVCVPSRCPR